MAGTNRTSRMLELQAGGLDAVIHPEMGGIVSS